MQRSSRHQADALSSAPEHDHVAAERGERLVRLSMINHELRREISAAA